MTQPLGFWTIALHFLRLAEASCGELVACENVHVVVTDGPPVSSEQLLEITKWSDFAVGIAVLFDLFHGVELVLKGFISAREAIPATHKLTRLLEVFEKHYPSTVLGEILNGLLLDVPAESPLGRFMSENTLTIDDWYLALRYPGALDGTTYSHIDLKYGGTGTVDFWRDMGETARRIRYEAVELCHVLELA